MKRALDLFCRAGGATKGLQRAGFHVTGVDILPQPKYCGDEFHLLNALEFPPEGFDFIWASPPCQRWSRLRHLHKHKVSADLITETRRRLIESGIPYCIENVEEAPLGNSGFLIMLCGTMFGLKTLDGRGELRRHRLFETSFSIPLRPACQHSKQIPVSVCGKGGHLAAARKVVTVCGHTPADNTVRSTIATVGTGSPKAGRYTVSVTGAVAQSNVVRNTVREVFTASQAREVMGIDWMGMKDLSQAVPPAYSEFIARQFLSQVTL